MVEGGETTLLGRRVALPLGVTRAWRTCRRGRPTGFAHRLPASDLGARPRARHGRGRPLGRAARRAGDLGAAGHVSDRDGLRRDARLARRAAAGRRGWHRGVGDPARRRGDDRAPLATLVAAALVGFFAVFPRPRARHGAAPRRRAVFSTASASWWPPAACTRSASRSAPSTAGRQAESRCGSRVAASDSLGSSSFGGQSDETPSRRRLGGRSSDWC